MKSRLAFTFSVDKLPNEFCYLWTFTFKRVLSVKAARALWSQGMREFRRRGILSGIRAFEMHPGGHGLHIHLVTAQYVTVGLVRHIWTGVATDFEGGRINVVKRPKSAAHYIGKYLTKQKRPACLKGARMWQAVGDFKAVPVKNIVRQCALTRAYKLASTMIPEWATFPFWRKCMMAKFMVKNQLRSLCGADLLTMPVMI